MTDQPSPTPAAETSRRDFLKHAAAGAAGLALAASPAPAAASGSA